ncbi:hypothetical protein [Streptomyces sp. cg35]|uniref:hypothetical protein n=1 Tax=Streptomyces sp. cg35 TaxID=3421650 RepID=UPI003D16B8DD
MSATITQHDPDDPHYLDKKTHQALLDAVTSARLDDHPQDVASPREDLLNEILTVLGIAPPPPPADRATCPSLYAIAGGGWVQCQERPGHHPTDDHTAPWNLFKRGRRWRTGDERAMLAREFTGDAPEYLSCGATIDPADGPTYTCARRVGHRPSPCSPDRDPE